MHAGLQWAASVERSVVRDLERYASVCARLDEALHVSTAHIAGGLAVFVAPGSPVNMWYGAGLEGRPVDNADLDAVEHFYAQRGTSAAISLCPLADASLVAQLGARGWMLTDFENVLYRRLRPLDPAELPLPAEGVSVRLAETPAERAEWARLSAEAFGPPAAQSPEAVRLAEASAAREDVTLLIASVDGKDAGVGALWVDGDLGWMLGDATREGMRGRGAQSALIGERMRLAARLGCEQALAEARPGSSSQRNMERLGCAVAYTRSELIARPR